MGRRSTFAASVAFRLGRPLTDPRRRTTAVGWGERPSGRATRLQAALWVWLGGAPAHPQPSPGRGRHLTWSLGSTTPRRKASEAPQVLELPGAGGRSVMGHGITDRWTI